MLVLAIKVSAWSVDNPEHWRDYAYYIALKEQLNVGEFLAVIECESSFQNVQSGFVKDGKREESYGIVQIHIPSHSVSKEQALNPFFSINWMRDKWLEGKKGIWSCWHTAGKNYLLKNS